jgi:hypothetical protein
MTLSDFITKKQVVQVSKKITSEWNSTEPLTVNVQVTPRDSDFSTADKKRYILEIKLWDGKSLQDVRVPHNSTHLSRGELLRVIKTVYTKNQNTDTSQQADAQPNLIHLKRK